MIVSEFAQRLFNTIVNDNDLSLRQAPTPNRLQGRIRINATFPLLVGGSQPLGAAVCGLFGGLLGLPWTLVVGEIGMLLAVLWRVASARPSVRAAPSRSAGGPADDAR